MKTVLTKFLAISSISLLMLASCKKNDPIVTTNGGTPGALTASASTLVLDKSKVSDTATKVITFTVTPPQYSYKAAVTNTLQIDSVGDNWKNPQNITLSTGVYSQAYSTPAFNAILLKILPAGVSSSINVRVQHSLSSAVATYSNVVSMTVTPFNLTSWIYVAGAFEGWTVPGTGVDSLVSLTGNGVYTGIINFTAGNTAFKILLNPKNYTGNIGSDGTATGLTSASTQTNITSTVTGQTIVTVDLNLNTVSFTLANHYSVIGDAALGWNATGDDTEMKYINDGTGNWSVVLPLVSTGSFKVRQNDDWTWSWGIPKAGSDGDGVANTLNDNNNNNITIATSGNYKVTFYDPASPATSATPTSTTTTYSVTKQ